MSKYCSNLFVLVKRNRGENKNKRKKFNTTYLICYHLNNCSLRLMFGCTENFRVFTSPSRSSLQLACLRPLLFLKPFWVNLTYKPQAKLLSQMNFYINRTNKFKKLLNEFQLHSHSIYIILKKNVKICFQLFVLVKRKRREKTKGKYSILHIWCVTTQLIVPCVQRSAALHIFRVFKGKLKK